MKKINVGIVFGGLSNEHNISIKSAYSIIKNIDNKKYNYQLIYINKDNIWYRCKTIDKYYNVININKINNIISYLKIFDVLFPILHGKYGEDGTIQGLFNLFNLKYVGCDILSSSLAIDKVYTKMILNQGNIKQAKFMYIIKDNNYYYLYDNKFNYKILSLNKIIKEIDNILKYPIYTKPSKEGSSIGIYKSSNNKELKKNIINSLKYDCKILIEEELKGQEIECGILKINNKIITSPLGEILLKNDFYTFDNKYKNNTKTIIPARVNKTIERKIKDIAIKCFKIINGKSLARIDFIVDKDNIYVNEINTMPGFTTISMYPKMFDNLGIKYSKLIDILIQEAINED